MLGGDVKTSLYLDISTFVDFDRFWGHVTSL